MIFIGYNYDGFPISIVNAKNQELAYAYWQGLGLIPHSHKCLEKDFTPIEEHMTGVYPILKTQTIDGYTLSEFRNRNKEFLLVSK